MTNIYSNAALKQSSLRLSRCLIDDLTGKGGVATEGQHVVQEEVE